MDATDWIATIAAVIAVVAAIASWRQVAHARNQAEAAKGSLALQEKMWRDATQPYVYVDIRPDPRNGSMLLLIIENIGRSVATNVRVEFNPPLESATEKFRDIGAKKALAEGIPAMPPGARVSHFFGLGFELASSNLPKSYSVKITGDGPLGALDPLEYKLDLNALLLEGPVLAEGTLYDLTRAIRKLTDKIK
ncbi:hypothetical protein Acsp03_51210 [Actinomadura sp. NBRC 104412]|uniref:hypothetical protein n=1 Tax=Actinomadura sp. NBRC 104412 TaxID=3032203 RepID=UPI0024A0E7BF|nr:hypothetical protein [Actinomadura sp. NBRC 104412]GLZ07655.1 hypothetical protein Acsp03_51210 [Actinomadura sp. NBRC 104412]